MKTRLLVVFGLAATLVLSGFFLFAVPETPTYNPYLTTVQLRDLNIEVRTLGTLEARNSHMISSQIKGPGAKIIFLARNGTFVARDEILVRFDPKPFEDAVAELSSKVESLAAAVAAAEQLVEWEKNEAKQRILAAQYQHRVAQLELQRLIKGDGPLKLAQYQDELNKAELELRHHQSYEKDLRQLQKEGIANPAELDRVREDLKQLADTHRSAQRQYESYRDYVLPVLVESGKEKEKNAELAIEQVKQASVHKIANAEATLRQMQANLKASRQALEKAEAELEKTTITAPFDGLIIHYEAYRNGEMRLPREGDTVIINQPILYFPDISDLIVRSRFREVDLHRVEINQQATVRVDAYPDELFEAKLSFIGALAKKQAAGNSEEKYFQAVFSLQGSDERLRPGMSARIVVHVASLHEVPTIPINSVFQDNNGDFCYLFNGVMYEKRYVTTGRQNDDFIEIKKGLTLGATVSQIQPETSQ